MIVGKTSGARKSWFNRVATRPRRRTSDSAAMVASAVARHEDATASSMLSAKALRMLARRKNSKNQRSDRPGGGKVKNSVGENAASTTTRIGPMMMRKASAVTAGRMKASPFIRRAPPRAAAAAP